MASDDTDNGPERRTPGSAARDDTTIVAAERLLRSLQKHDISYIFANLGTDHAPILEAAVRLRENGNRNEFPELVTCPHEFAAMSAAHGYTMVTGQPQAVLVHVDVGTQNLGAAMHNAHRSRVPMLVIAGLAPITDDGYVGSRNNVVQYFQDVFDQPAIVREYCRWTNEYQPPADPECTIVRAIERSSDVPQGPTYITATREALETPIPRNNIGDRSVRSLRRPRADDERTAVLAEAIEAAESPLLVTSGYTTPDETAGINVLMDFAETAGAGIIEHSPTRLCFPRDHELHSGFNPAPAFEHADLVLAVDVDVPWVPWQGEPSSDATTIQIDPAPTKPTYPHWDFQFGETVSADPITTLAAVTDRLNPENGMSGREQWRTFHQSRLSAAHNTVADHRDAERLTPAVVSAAIEDLIDDSTVIVNDATTSSRAIFDYIHLSEPGSYYSCSGSGLGWGASAAVGVKLAVPEKRVLSLVGDGSYVFANPTACAWFAAAHDAPTVTIVYNNSGWNAVSLATLNQHPDGETAEHGVPGSAFDPRLELAHPANVVDAHTQTVATQEELRPKLREAFQAADHGTPAVLDVHIEPI